MAEGSSIYQIPRIFWRYKLTAVIPHQQHKPIKIGFIPVLIRLIRFVFVPMAAIAMTMKNLLRFFRGSVTAAGRWNTVVATEASRKKRTKNGNIFFKFTDLPEVFFSFLAL